MSDQRMREMWRDGEIPWRELQSSGFLDAEVLRIRQTCERARINRWNLQVRMIVTAGFEAAVICFVWVRDEEEGDFVGERMPTSGSQIDREYLEEAYDVEPDNLHLEHCAYRHWERGSPSSDYFVGLNALAGNTEIYDAAILRKHVRGERV